jgi:hypothetical protein
MPPAVTTGVSSPRARTRARIGGERHVAPERAARVAAHVGMHS